MKIPSSTRSARLAAAVLLLGTALAQGAPIELVPGSVNMFRDHRSDNNVGVPAGDRFQFGADVVGGSAGTTLGAIYPGDGYEISQFDCAPGTVNPRNCARTRASEDVVGRLAKPWTLRFQRAGEAELTVPGPPLNGTGGEAPLFPVNVSIAGSGTTPTISWTIPGDFAADAVRIQIWDRSLMRGNQIGDIVHSFAVPSSLTSYELPALLSSGRQLAIGGDYVFNIQLVDTRDDPALFVATNNNAHILRRSSSFFNFSPLAGGGPPNAFLPTVQDGVYRFSVTDVGPNSVTFIDPLVAVGYD